MFCITKSMSQCSNPWDYCHVGIKDYESVKKSDSCLSSIEILSCDMVSGTRTSPPPVN